jgi:hypothetical protein
MSAYQYWTPKALDYSTKPTQLAYYLFFDNQDASERDCLEKGVRGIIGGAFILLSLPFDLLIGLFILPIGMFHDMFAFIGNCFDYVINKCSFKNSYTYQGGLIASMPTLFTGAIILNNLGVDTGWFEGPDNDLLASLATTPFFLLSIPLSLVLLAIVLPIAMGADILSLFGNCCNNDSPGIQY